MGWSANRRVGVGLGLAVAAVVCVGCARALVQNVQEDRSLTLPRPARVVVVDFTTGPADVQVLSSPRQEAKRALWLSQEQPSLLAEAVADRLATRLVEDIRSLGLPAERVAGAARKGIFVIHNGKLSEAPSPTPRSLCGIASRVLEASVRAGVVNDLIRIFAFAQRDQASFHWVTIDESVDLQGAEVFDPVKMGELYEIGDRTARAGPAWEVRPPGFQDMQPPP